MHHVLTNRKALDPLGLDVCEPPQLYWGLWKNSHVVTAK